MALNNAERQRAYRERHLGIDGTKVRVGLILDVGAAAGLRRLARHRGTTVTKVIEELTRRSEQAVLNHMTDSKQRKYLRRMED